MTENSSEVQIEQNDTPETGQTGQIISDRRSYFEVAQDQNGKWHWVLWSGNGRAMAINAIIYERRNDCTNAISAIKRDMNQSTKVVVAHS